MSVIAEARGMHPVYVLFDGVRTGLPFLLRDER
jgi:hypothetical protein